MINIFNGSSDELVAYIKSRTPVSDDKTRQSVLDILAHIKKDKDSALFKYIEKFDGSKIDKDNLLLTKKEIEEAYNNVDLDFLDIIKRAKANIEEFHQKQLQKTWMMTRDGGSVLGQIVRPLKSAGIYVPGGTASYPSSVLMNAIPAKIAGVDRIAMATPFKNNSINPYTVVAANECGIDEIYKMGGVQAIGALAYGTESVKKVDKIVGPGNIYVATAKKEVYGYVDIDMIAGPSEILIIADENANPAFIAADMMSQAEHDVLASSVLITTSKDLIDKVIIEIEKQIKALGRSEIIEKSFKDHSAAIYVDSIEDGIEIANAIAPEHLEIMVDNPFEYLDSIKNAGSIFMGHYSPEPLGDYFAGPNHVLPTGGTAAFFSPLSVDDFIKKSSYIYYSEKNLKKEGEYIRKFAGYEGLSAHANSIEVRLK